MTPKRDQKASWLSSRDLRIFAKLRQSIFWPHLKIEWVAGHPIQRELRMPRVRLPDGGSPQTIESVCLDMSPAYIKGVGDSLPKARITFDKFHLVAHASAAVDKTRRMEQKRNPSLKGLR